MMNRTGEFWHVPVWEDDKTKERFIYLRDFKQIEQDMYDHLVASINIHGVGEKAFREFEKRNGLKKFEHTREER